MSNRSNHLLPGNSHSRQQGVPARRALSLVELSIGIAITGVLMLALAGFTVGVGAGWRHSSDDYKVRHVARRAGLQMEQALGGMLAAVQVKPGSSTGDSAYLFFWQNDAATGSADGKAQFGEMALLEYDPTSKAIWLYQVKPQSSMTAAQKTAANNDQWGDPTAASIVTYFKSSDIVAARQPVVGGASSADGGVTVSSCQFSYYKATGAKPLATFQLGLDEAGVHSTTFGNIALHSAQTPTNLN